MFKIKIKLLYILLSLFIFKSVLADESWYQTAANLHKKWAKTYHTVSDLERYTNIHKLIIGKDVELKPGKVFFPGYPNQVSLKAKISNGAMAKIIGAPDFAYNGEEFNSFGLGLAAGAGYDFTDNLFATARYSFGLTNRVDSDIVSTKMDYFQVGLGYRF